jgi:calcium-dependent protein kinase
VVHRDLKPENILLSDDSDGAVLRIVDYGCATFCRSGQQLNDRCGSPEYMRYAAP